MHWLNDQLTHLHELLKRQAEYEQMVEKKITGAEEGRKKARNDFLDRLKTLVVDIARRDGVTAAFSCHDGLLIEKAGSSDNFEALAAAGQSLVIHGRSVMRNIKYGELSQIVLVGDEMKLAFFAMGQIEIGIAAERNTDLTAILG